jgi:V/A-type H+-transporting ATPase subunit I
VYVKTKPAADEKPPILLKNNRFTRLFEPIGALFALPQYSELDLTVFFAPFFLLFFGLCLGDLGYGLIIVIATTYFKTKIKDERRNYLTLAQWLGLSTIIAGTFSGTLFGLEMARLEFFENYKALFLDYDKLFNLALGIGLVQILFGIGVNAYKQWIFLGPRFAMSKIGWMLLLIALVDVYLLELAPAITKMLLWAALALIIIFGAPEKGWIKSIAIGVTDLYSITGVFGDLLSYIRLFALGVSSAILGIVVNSIALSAKGVPYLGYFFFLLILVIGHTANLMLSSLSAFVHPMRLTFVEFYKNSGFLGGGKPFVPLARTARNQSSTQ